MKIIFTNAGLIDLKAITTFGANVKTNDSPIGYFGTGLKYAIAVLLREGCELTLYRGHEAIHFTACKELIRDKEFSVCYMEETPLGFTTELGKNWKVWQAFRELYCNAMDENGTVFAAYAASDVIKSEQTTFVATGDSIVEAYNKRSETILLSSPIVQTEICDIHPGQTHHIFYKGIRVYTASNPFLFTYNFTTKQTLIEDRTLAYPWDISPQIGCAVLSISNKSVLKYWLTAGKGLQENDINLESNNASSAAFIEMVKELRISRNINLNFSSIKFYEKTARESLSFSSDTLNEVQKSQLAYGIGLCHTLGATVNDYPIIVSEHLVEGVLGLAEDNKIYISKRVFDMGDDMVASTLYEEYIHLKYEHKDESRRMQNFLFEKLIATARLLRHVSCKVTLEAESA